MSFANRTPHSGRRRIARAPYEDDGFDMRGAYPDVKIVQSGGEDLPQLCETTYQNEVGDRGQFTTDI